MTLRTFHADPVGPNTPFVLVPPGEYYWNVYTVCATLSRAVGGTGTRTPVLQIGLPNQVLLTSPFIDTAPDPGTITVTWMQVAQVQPTVLANGAVTAPLPLIRWEPGYRIVGDILNAQPGDQWLSALAFVDYEYTG